MFAKAVVRDVTPANAIDRLIDRYGATAVLWSTIRALLRPRRRRPRPPDPYSLSPHMRRDIGLPPPERYVPKYYELR